MINNERQGHPNNVKPSSTTSEGCRYTHHSSWNNLRETASANNATMASLHMSESSFGIDTSAPKSNGNVNSNMPTNLAYHRTHVIRSTKPSDSNFYRGDEGLKKDSDDDTSGNKIINSSANCGSSEEDYATGKPQPTRKMPYFYCKTLGWDPKLNTFHIQLDTLDSNPRDVPQPPPAATTHGKNSMTSPPTTTETVDEQSISETKNDSSESEQSTGNPVEEAPTRKPAETVIRGVTQDSSETEDRLNLKANADLKSKASNNVPSNLSSTMTAESGSREEEVERRETPEQRVSGESAEVRNDDIDSDKEKMPIPENNRLELHAGGNNDFDDDNALVIDTGGVDEAEAVVKRRESEASDKTELIKKRQSVESEGASSDKNDDNKSSHSQDGNEDFRCQVCHKMFSNDEEVNTHFSSEHFRPVVGDSILEPPSPFPSHIVTVEGHSSIFDDEVEESEPVQVEVETQLTEYPGATLSALLLRRNSADEGEVRDPGYPQGVVRAPSHQYLAHQQRHPIPIGGRGLPAPRMHGGHPPPPGMRMGPPSSHLQQIHRPPPFSTALRQALLNNGQSQGPPQLRPMPGIQLRGAPHLPGRPPLHRGPPPVQHILPQPRNPQSLLRQPLEVSSQFSEGFAELSSKVIALDSDINLMDNLQKREANPLVRQQYYDKKNELLHARQLIIKRMEGVQKQNELQLLRQHQLDMQSAQHQQLRQQQLIQSRSHTQVGPHNIHGHPVLNENGKRPAVTISEAPSNLANLAKQPRIDDQMSRLQNGLIIRPVIPQSSPSPTGHPHQPHTVEVGMHSGGSTGSRHSSGSNSPAIPSPGAQHRQSQIVTPASPLPLTLSPPDNPNLSPISDNSQSPRGSPRINVGSLVQNVMTTCIPGASAQSNFVSPKPPAQRLAVNTKERIVTVPHSERPDRPPTVDLTDDDILTHNAQMRATGRGIVTQDQIQIHEAAMQQRRNAMPIPGTSQFTIRPIHNQGSAPAQPQRQFLCSPCNLPFNTIEEVNNHSVRVHGHRPTSQAQSFRAPQPNQVIRRASPGAMPQIRPNPTTIHHGAPQPRPGPSVSRERMPTQPSTRQHENNQSRQIIMVEDSKQLVIPIIDIEKLDDAKMNHLRELGVMEFIPVESMRRLGIPIMKFEPNMRLGHFPHDSAITIGSSYQIMSPDQRQPQPPTLRRASPASIPHSSHAPTQPSHHPNPPVVMSPPMGAIYTERPCQDRNCQETIRRPSPTSVIHPNLAHSNNQIRPIHPNHPLNRQYPQRSAHDSFLGGSGNQFGGSR